jgi:hypothetical protein
MNQTRLIGIGILLLLLLLNPPTFASVKQDEGCQEETASERVDTKPPIMKWVDRAHGGLSRGLLETSERVDALFGDEQYDEDIQHSQFRLTTSAKIAEGERPDLSFPVHVNLVLPQLQDRLQLFVDTILHEDEHSDLVDTETSHKHREEDKDENGNDITVGIQYRILQKARQWLCLGASVNVRSDESRPLGKLWLKKAFNFEPWVLRVTQYGLWFKEGGWGETSRVDIERRITQNMFSRMTSKATWTPNSEGMNLAQSFFFHSHVSQNWAIALEFSGKGHTKPALVADKYLTSITLRRRLYKNWLFFEVEPQAQFLREEDFELTPLIIFNFEMRFGDIPDM